MFEVEFYETVNGKIPVQEFLDSLPPKLNAKALRDIELLENYGNKLREPFSKSEGNGIFELRTIFGNDITRIFYFFTAGKKIILTNGYIKKTQKTPINEIVKALQYKTDYESRHNI